MLRRIILIVCLLILAIGCSSNNVKFENNDNSSVYYQIFVGSFADSNDDGVGDIRGIIEKLDYLESLNIKGIWLTPVHPSDTYHKYDVKDYYDIDQEFGTLEDFEELLIETEKRNIEIIMDLVLNHSSDQHQWFIDAKTNILNGSCDKQDSFCDYYTFYDEFTNNSAKLNEDIYYEASFTGNMPDLNLDNPKVIAEIENVVKYWLDKGVDGFRLDASIHYFDQPTKNIEFLSWFSDYVKSINSKAFIVSEVWADSSTILSYYDSGIDSLFNFDGSTSTGVFVRSVRSESGSYLANWLMDYQQKMLEINSDAIDSVFLSNHDQARSFGYLYGFDEKQFVLTNAILLAPGRVYIYYGQELGMLGSGIDENKRLAMPWGDKYTANNPNNSDYDNIDSTVVNQNKDKSSLLNQYRELIFIRGKYQVFEKGLLTSLETNDKAIYAMLYEGEETIIVLHNFSGEVVKFTIEYEIESYDKVDYMEESEIDGKIASIAPYSSIVIKIKES